MSFKPEPIWGPRFRGDKFEEYFQDFRKFHRMIEGRRAAEGIENDKAQQDLGDGSSDGVELEDDDDLFHHAGGSNASSIRDIVRQGGGLYSKLHQGDVNEDFYYVRCPTSLEDKIEYFKELVFNYMLIIDKILNDQVIFLTKYIKWS